MKELLLLLGRWHDNLIVVAVRLSVAKRLHAVLLEPVAFARVELPVEEHLILDELAAWRVNQLGAEVWFVEQLEHVQGLRVPQVLHVGRCAPVLKVLEVVDELLLLEVVTLSQKVEIIRIRQALHKLQFHLKANGVVLKHRFWRKWILLLLLLLMWLRDADICWRRWVHHFDISTYSTLWSFI